MTELVHISRKLSTAVEKLQFALPVTHVYNPLAYARIPHELYLERWGRGPKRVLLLGMNPGPFGMAQTGVPFGDVCLVRDWLGVQGRVAKPAREHPKRPVLGFGCARREISGSRLWGWAKQRFETPARFFEQFFVVNYCPLAFMDEGGRNVTPDKLSARERSALFEACDAALRAIVDVLEPQLVIGVGAFAEQRARQALLAAEKERRVLRVGTILHPSPASPKANADWAGVAEAQLKACGVDL